MDSILPDIAKKLLNRDFANLASASSAAAISASRSASCCKAWPPPQARHPAQVLGADGVGQACDTLPARERARAMNCKVTVAPPATGASNGDAENSTAGLWGVAGDGPASGECSSDVRRAGERAWPLVA